MIYKLIFAEVGMFYIHSLILVFVFNVPGVFMTTMAKYKDWRLKAEVPAQFLPLVRKHSGSVNIILS